jgi:hypothetical protein
MAKQPFTRKDLADMEAEIKVEVVRDVSRDFRMPQDSFAAILRDGTGHYWVAWGRGYDVMLGDGAGFDEENTAEHGVTENSFDTPEAAEAYVTTVRECHESTDPT